MPVTHYSRLCMAVIDVPEPDHDGELAFWRGAIGQPMKRLEAHPEYHGAQLHGQQAWLLIQRLGDGPPRIHLDFHTDDLDAEVVRLEALGAQRVQRLPNWWTMKDPAGLPFCIVLDPPGVLTEANAQRWD
jgi:hypothetical protein